jgi:hypothetical protein
MLLDEKELTKTSSKFFEDENDIFWRLKVENFLQCNLSTTPIEATPSDMTHRGFYESFFYEKIIETSYWRNLDIDDIMKSEDFLTRHIEARDTNGMTILFEVAHRYPQYIEKLLSYGANVHARDGDGQTPLMEAASFCCKSVKPLLEAGANIEDEDNAGFTPLIHACINQEKESIKILLDAGANPKHPSIKYVESLSWSYDDEIIQMLKEAIEKIVS